MIVLIYVKWLTDWSDSEPPLIIGTLINMALKLGELSVFII